MTDSYPVNRDAVQIGCTPTVLFHAHLKISIMALDARITEVVEYKGGITICLEDRVVGSNEAGQLRMEILNPTVAPLVGDELWGGAGFAHIVSGGVEYPYKREGYTKLVQDW